MNSRHTVIALLALLPALAFAQANTPRVDQRQANQQHRIEQGVASGSLTRREAHRLEHGQQRVDRIEDRAKADGAVTRHERARLHHAQEVQGRRIAVQRQDRQHDYNHNGRIDRLARR